MLMFADSYLNKNNRVALIGANPFDKLGISVVIPCFREPEILKTLKSLTDCNLPKSNVEVIILINHSEVADESIKSFNLQTFTEIQSWSKKNSSKRLSFFPVGPIELQKKWAGAGLARKWGMDEAVRRFNLLGKPEGIIVSLDADTLVEENYLVEIESYFIKNPKHVGATISFQHQTKGLGKKHLSGILLYEKYMEYYKKALGFIGYPYPMFTVGSAFAVTAEAYVKRGGMNRRQAGEDFYFLQNLVQLGTVGEISTTKVYPSARLSDRVPFGTGPILQKWMKGEEDLTITYNFQAFEDIKQFFAIKDMFYKADKERFNKLLKDLPKSIQRFVEEDNFWTELNDLNQNCSSTTSFQSRFFQKFNAFKILKFLNFSHDLYYKKASLTEQIELLRNYSEK